MTEDPDRMVLALVEERTSYLDSGQASRVISVDEQLAVRGWCVDTSGQLVRVTDRPDRRRRTAKRAAAPERTDSKPPEDTAEPQPRHRD